MNSERKDVRLLLRATERHVKCAELGTEGKGFTGEPWSAAESSGKHFLGQARPSQLGAGAEVALNDTQPQTVLTARRSNLEGIA